MTSLGELREALDKIDNEIAELYEKRMEVCRKVGEYKVKSGKKVFDRQREKEKLADVMSKVEGDFNKKGIQELYQQLMSMSRKLQYSQLVEAGALGRLPFIRIENLDRENARVVFQGTEGAYSQAAMYNFLPEADLYRFPGKCCKDLVPHNKAVFLSDQFGSDVVPISPVPVRPALPMD